jgi:hypothetical protein
MKITCVNDPLFYLCKIVKKELQDGKRNHTSSIYLEHRRTNITFRATMGAIGMSGFTAPCDTAPELH